MKCIIIACNKYLAQTEDTIERINNYWGIDVSLFCFKKPSFTDDYTLLDDRGVEVWTDYLLEAIKGTEGKFVFWLEDYKILDTVNIQLIDSMIEFNADKTMLIGTHSTRKNTLIDLEKNIKFVRNDSTYINSLQPFISTKEYIISTYRSQIKNIIIYYNLPF